MTHTDLLLESLRECTAELARYKEVTRANIVSARLIHSINNRHAMNYDISAEATAIESRSKTAVFITEGLTTDGDKVFRFGRELTHSEINDLALHHGYLYAERLISALEKYSPNLLDKKSS